ncbi:MAG TPA: hypothetical protein VJ933_01125 [Phaeodactylibacter sp.]|nr:hypothetical protein [Phaeodactylibacter sp.]
MRPNDLLKKQFLAIVDQQLKENDPPETRQTLERLQTQEGFTRDESRGLIAQCVAQEMTAVMIENEPFNRERYLKLLAELPNPPMPND